jgi:hypothetical protein
MRGHPLHDLGGAEQCVNEGSEAIQVKSPPGTGTTIEARIPILQSWDHKGEPNAQHSPTVTPATPG